MTLVIKENGVDNGLDLVITFLLGMFIGGIAAIQICQDHYENKDK